MLLQVQNVKFKRRLFCYCSSRPYVKGEKYDDQVFKPTYENLIKLLGNEKVQGKEKLLNILENN